MWTALDNPRRAGAELQLGAARTFKGSGSLVSGGQRCRCTRLCSATPERPTWVTCGDHILGSDKGFCALKLSYKLGGTAAEHPNLLAHQVTKRYQRATNMNDKCKASQSMQTSSQLHRSHGRCQTLFALQPGRWQLGLATVGPSRPPTRTRETLQTVRKSALHTAKLVPGSGLLAPKDKTPGPFLETQAIAQQTQIRKRAFPPG